MNEKQGGVPADYYAKRLRKERAKAKEAQRKNLQKSRDLGYNVSVPIKSNVQGIDDIASMFDKIKIKATRTKKQPEVDTKNIISTKRASLRPTKEVKMTDVRPSTKPSTKPSTRPSIRPSTRPSTKLYVKISTKPSAPTKKDINELKLHILSKYSEKIQKQVKPQLMNHTFRSDGDLSKKIIDKITKILNDRIKGLTQARVEELYPDMLREDITIVKYSSLSLNRPEKRSIDNIINTFIEEIKYNHKNNRANNKTQKQVIEEAQYRKQMNKKTDDNLASLMGKTKML